MAERVEEVRGLVFGPGELAPLRGVGSKPTIKGKGRGKASLAKAAVEKGRKVKGSMDERGG
ncbi:hypothetical protein AMTR_s00005p00215580 [Amborella trichopoda]|uniref:Uncharacterized protein n=1 Tax=Amborella trichopoda TaxID=13333 RepID=W1PFU2_AMBTC|nr:hypothetical protein AMTR_s00005p00215580 [Amborella trichopoda]